MTRATRRAAAFCSGVARATTERPRQLLRRGRRRPSRRARCPSTTRRPPSSPAWRAIARRGGRMVAGHDDGLDAAPRRGVPSASAIPCAQRIGEARSARATTPRPPSSRARARSEPPAAPPASRSTGRPRRRRSPLPSPASRGPPPAPRSPAPPSRRRRRLRDHVVDHGRPSDGPSAEASSVARSRSSPHRRVRRDRASSAAVNDPGARSRTEVPTRPPRRASASRGALSLVVGDRPARPAQDRR